MKFSFFIVFQLEASYPIICITCLVWGLKFLILQLFCTLYDYEITTYLPSYNIQIVYRLCVDAFRRVKDRFS